MYPQGTPTLTNPAIASICPDPVKLSADQVTAALFTWSELPDETDTPAAEWVRDDLAAIVSAQGTALIGTAARRLSAVVPDAPALAARLAWCRQAASLVTGTSALAVTR